MVIVAACASLHRPSTSVGTSEESLAHAAGIRIAAEYGTRFRVYRGFVTVAEHEVQETPAPAAPSRLVEAFRAGTRVSYADTTAMHAHIPASLRSADERWIYALARAPVVRGDSGFVDIFTGKVVENSAAAEMSVMRYEFLRADARGSWRFVRRVLVYGA